MVLLIIAASVAATLYYASSLGGLSFLKANAQTPDAAGENIPASETNTPPPLSIKPIFTSLDPFTVTLNDGRRTRVLHVAITLRVEDDASRRLVTEFMPMVRDRVLKVLAAQDPSRIQSAEGREELVIALTDSLRSSYDPSPATPRISDVLFTAFVIQ